MPFYATDVTVESHVEKTPSGGLLHAAGRGEGTGGCRESVAGGGGRPPVQIRTLGATTPVPGNPLEILTVWVGDIDRKLP